MTKQLRIRILGSAAGGGFPQWNCGCLQCEAVRAGDDRYTARTQSSIALSRDERSWLLVNASPDLLTQFKDNLPPSAGSDPRRSHIASVLLMDAQIDHITGLIMLRENNRPIELCATPEVLSDLTEAFPVLPLLSHYCGVNSRQIDLAGPELTWPWLTETAIQVQSLNSKPPPYSRWRHDPRPGDNLGITVFNKSSGQTLFYAPSLGEMTEDTWDALNRADIVLVDGTFWTNDEMVRQGLGTKSAQSMGHLALSGQNGLLTYLAKLPQTTRKVLIHINNSNPILCTDSIERQILDRLRIEIAHDGMEILF